MPIPILRKSHLSGKSDDDVTSVVSGSLCSVTSFSLLIFVFYYFYLHLYMYRLRLVFSFTFTSSLNNFSFKFKYFYFSIFNLSYVISITV